MLIVGLAAHYKRTVEIDVCKSCTLIWFDDTESVRLAGPGIADLVSIIHEATQLAKPLGPLPLALPCPVCAAPLKRVHNISRFGRTAQLQCPQGHGMYQTFALFLAEKGYYRPYTWEDIRRLTHSGERVECNACGATLEPRPQDVCSYCQSPVGLIDPARLASAIDVDRAAGPVGGIAEADQTICPGCGGAIDLTRDVVCRHCKAVVLPTDTEGAATASNAVDAEVRENYVQQNADVSRRKMEETARTEPLIKYSVSHRDNWRRGGVITSLIFMLGLVIFQLVGRDSLGPVMTIDEEGNKVWINAQGARQTARHEVEATLIQRAPSGITPPQLLT